jgi:transposase
MDKDGRVLWEGPLSNTIESFITLKNQWPAEAYQAVLEAGRNWGPLYDILDELGFHPQLANPNKVRMIADSFIKTDKIDARALAFLLRNAIVPQVHVPPKEIRDQKNLLRQRQWLVREQTRIKNRIHNVLDRNHAVAPNVTDVFGQRGRLWMSQLSLPEIDQQLLTSDLAFLDHVQAQIRQTEKWIDQVLQNHPYIPYLISLPGFGTLLSALAALEIHDIARFSTIPRFTAYCGLALSTYSSANRTTHGSLIPACNHYLRYAFVEAAWTAVRTSPYFVAYYKRLRYRLRAQEAILQVSRRLCEIAYVCLKNRRHYQERPYTFRPSRLRPSLAA